MLAAVAALALSAGALCVRPEPVFAALAIVSFDFLLLVAALAALGGG